MLFLLGCGKSKREFNDSRSVEAKDPVIVVRPDPLRELAPTRQVLVSDFGALPDDGISDSVGIQSAIQSLLGETESCELVFEKGVYWIDDAYAQTGRTGHAFSFDGIRNLLISGNGAYLLMKKPNVGVMRFNECENVIVRGFEIDYDPIPFVSGTVRKINPLKNSFRLELEFSSPSFEDDFIEKAPQKWGYFLHPEVAGRVRTDGHNVYSPKEVQKLSSRVYEITLEGEMGDERFGTYSVGSRYVQVARYNGSALFFTHRSKQVTFENIVSYMSPAGHYAGSLNEAINIIGCKALVKPGRFKGGNADGVHMQNCRIGPWIEDCQFEGISDDCVNVYIKPFHICSVISDTELVLCRGRDSMGSVQGLTDRHLRIGDMLAFFEPREDTSVGSAAVVAFDLESNRVTLDKPVLDLREGTDKAFTQVYNLNLSKGVLIRGNTFANSRRYGNLIKAQDVLIEKNRFWGLSNAAITLHNQPDWPEGLYSRGVTIRNNSFEGCGFSRLFFVQRNAAVVSVYAKVKHSSKSESEPFYGHSGVTIAKNTFSDWTRRCIMISNTESVEIVSNNFMASKIYKKKHPIETIVFVQDSKAVSVQNNRIGTGAVPEAVKWVTSENVESLSDDGNAVY